MKHYLFIKDNDTEILSVIKDNMRRWNIICLSRQWNWILPIIKVIWKDDTLSVIEDNIRKWNTICLSKIMKLNITGYQGNIKKMGYYPLSKVEKSNSTDYQDNMTRQTKHHRLSRWYGKIGHYPLSKVEKSNITNYQSNTKRLKVICLSKINIRKGKHYLFIKIIKLNIIC
jgi:hypothetical protein